MARLSESQWINLFLRRLGSLESALDIVNAMRYAMKVYGDAPDLEPEVAAEAYVADLAPGRGSQPVAKGVERERAPSPGADAPSRMGRVATTTRFT